MTKKRKPADEAPAEPTPAVEPVVEQLDERVDPSADAAPADMAGEDGFGVSEFGDTPVAHPEIGKAIDESEIPYPDWMIALDEVDAEYDIAFRLRGRREDQAIHRSVASLATVTDLAYRFQTLGWGGDATITRLADGVVISIESAPLTDPDAPI